MSTSDDNEDDASGSPLGITPAAAEALREALGGVDGDSNFIRVYIAGGGCSGLQYGLAVDDNAEDLDQRFEIDGLPFVIDAVSLKYIVGSVLDHTGGFMGAFRFDNPKAVSKCGCGSSFKTGDLIPDFLDTNKYGGCGSCSSQKG